MPVPLLPFPLLREWLANLALAGLYIHFAHGFWKDYLAYGRWSSLVFIVFELLLVAIFLIRRHPVNVSWQPRDWLYALMGTLLPLLFIPCATTPNSLLQLVQTLGMGFSLCGVLSLWRSFGVVPANRGIRTGGLLSVVRHPIYLGYLVAYSMFILQHHCGWNLIIFTLHSLSLLARIEREEAHLLQDTAYQAYVQQVRWRLLPGVW